LPALEAAARAARTLDASPVIAATAPHRRAPAPRAPSGDARGTHATIALRPTRTERRLVAKAEKGEGVEGGPQQPPLLRGLFGTLYTLAKEKINDNLNFALATIGIDFVMVVLLFIVPEYPWALEDDSLWVAGGAAAAPAAAAPAGALPCPGALACRASCQPTGTDPPAPPCSPQHVQAVVVHRVPQAHSVQGARSLPRPAVPTAQRVP
jgi:hypothetical protein